MYWRRIVIGAPPSGCGNASGAKEDLQSATGHLHQPNGPGPKSAGRGHLRAAIVSLPLYHVAQ